MSKTIPSHAQVVIIGGGIIGCSIAYHLTKVGITDVVRGADLHEALPAQRSLFAALLFLVLPPLADAQVTEREAWVARYSGGANDEPTALVVDPNGARYLTGFSGGPNDRTVPATAPAGMPLVR